MKGLEETHFDCTYENDSTLIVQSHPGSPGPSLQWITQRFETDLKPIAFIVCPAVLTLANGSSHPRAARAWHHDSHTVIGLINDHERIQRGPTFWDKNGNIINAFRSLDAELERYLGDKRRERLGLMSELRSCGDIEVVRDAIKRLAITINLAALQGSIEAQRLHGVIDEATMAGAQKIDWGEHPRSTVFFSDKNGFHRSSGVDESTPRFQRILIGRRLR